jgi:hypothetical protein
MGKWCNGNNDGFLSIDMVFSRKGVGASISRGDLDHGGQDELYLPVDMHEGRQRYRIQASKVVR